MRVPLEVQRRKGAFLMRPWMVWMETLRSYWSWDERELVATAVSQANLASYCVAGHRPHAVFQLSEEQVAQALDDPERLSLTPARRALLEFAEELTLAPETMSAERVSRAICAGASVNRLRDVVEIAAVMNVMNRITTTVDKADPGGESRWPPASWRRSS